MAHSANAYELFVSVIGEIERTYPVAEWTVQGVPIWPLIRVTAGYELALAGTNGNAPCHSPAIQAIRHAGAPLFDTLRNWRDFRHETLRLKPADALFLTDGISQDKIRGVWRDRYCAPLIEALEADGKRCFLMHPGEKQNLPRERATYSAHWIDSWSRIAARFQPLPSLELKGFDDVVRLARNKGMDVTAFDAPFIQQAAVRIAVMARLFEYVLASARPQLFFAVSYYWDMGFAANLACRRRGVLSVDVQHGAQGGSHKAYNRWLAVPPDGYPVLPAVFWNWSQEDAQAINDWAGRLAHAWHVGVWGGHPQLAVWLDDTAEQTRHYDAEIAKCKERHPGDIDILVPLQDVESYGPIWDKLADMIRNGPRQRRWWLRRHPVPAYNRGASIANLLAIDQPNVIVEEASSLPLPALLRNVDAVLSAFSSAAIEAVFFGHKPVFLSESARFFFPDLVETGKADVITDFDALETRLSALAHAAGRRRQSYGAPDLPDTLRALWHKADEYRELAGS